MAATSTSQRDFSKGDSAGLVSIGSHSLYLRISGPQRQPGDPVVVIEAGHADTSLSWSAVVRHISPFARVCSYDRAGYGDSEPSSSPRTGRNIAEELLALLRAANIAPPYLLVGHSYGGILIREFLALLRPEEVAGMVLVDTNQEGTPSRRPMPERQFEAIMNGLDYYDIVGLEKAHKLTAEEWKRVKALGNVEGHEAAADGEARLFEANATELGLKRQFEKQVLGDKRLSVIKGNTARDMRLLVEAGVKAGNGSAEDRKVLEEMLDGLDGLEDELQREQLGLSRESRMVHAEESGHNVHMQQPDVIAQEVRWVLNMSS